MFCKKKKKTKNKKPTYIHFYIQQTENKSVNEWFEKLKRIRPEAEMQPLPSERLSLQNNLMEFLCMSDYDTTVLFKAISQKKN